MKKWTLVTGAAKRLGAEIALKLAAQGHNIVVHYRSSREEAESTAKACQKLGVEAETIQGDFSSLDSTQTFIAGYLKRFPHTQHLINNVGNYLIKPALETTVEEWADLFQTNLNAPFAISRALVPSLIKEKGSIINIGMAGVNNIHAGTYSTAYDMTKASLLILTKSMAKELAPQQVRVNMVSPGYLTNSVDIPSSGHFPMGRLAKLEEVSRVIIFLMDPASAYITGQNIEVAGGVRL